MCRILSFNRVVHWRPVTSLTWKLQYMSFPANYVKFFRTPIISNMCDQFLPVMKKQIRSFWLLMKFLQ